jgi:glycosyltransferase involved in cell wall biosynthesis
MADRLRIAQVAPLWYAVPPTTAYGGAELMIHLLTEELVRRGHTVTLFSTKDSRTAGRLEPVTDEAIFDAMLKDHIWCYEQYATSAVVDALRRADEFDVIHIHLGTAWVPIGRLARAPTVFTLHSVLFRDDGWVLERYPDQAVVGVSRSQVAAVADRRPAMPVVHNGIDFDTFNPRFEPGRYLVFLGRMSRFKHPAGAIAVARAVGMPIVLAGRPQHDDDQRYFRAEVEPLLDGVGVRWIGPVDHPGKVALLREAAALVFPNTGAEPFGLVMIEAMACGTPVVAVTIGSVPEVVDAGMTGYHAASLEDLPALVPQALALDRRRVRAHAESRFGHARMADRYLEIYRTLWRLKAP